MDEEWARLGAAAGRSIAEGRYADAATALRQAVALRPRHADSWFNLGYVLRQSRAYPEALDAYAEALRQSVTAPEAAHVNRAAILSEYMECNQEAEAELRAAIAANPKFLPAWLNLGGLMEDVGKADAAADAYRQALRIAPGNGRARARLAAIHIHKGDTSVAIGDLEQRLQIGADSHDDVGELLFGLGNALDAAGRYRDAFAAIAQANRLNAAMRPAARQYDRRAQERLVDELIAAFPERPVGPAADDGPEMLFICGMFRSGSTVTEQLIGRHPLVRIGGELELIPALVRERLAPYPASLRTMTTEQKLAFRNAYLHTVSANFPGACYVTDKRPDNFLHIGLIKMLFPAAQIVHTCRDPLDNILSLYFMNFADGITYSDHLEDSVHYFLQYRRIMDHWIEIFGEDIHTITYDKLVTAPTEVISAAWQALGLPASEIDSPDKKEAAVIRTPSNWKARSAIHGQSSGRWKNYAVELAAVRASLAATGHLH